MSLGPINALQETNIAIISYNYTIGRIYAEDKDNVMDSHDNLSFFVFFMTAHLSVLISYSMRC